MSMKDGIQEWVDSALDTKDDTAKRMIEAGVDPIQALLASSVVTKIAVANKLEEELGKRSAATITSKLNTRHANKFVN